MEKYDRENLDLYSNLLDEIKQNFNLDNEGAEAALLLIRERALSLELSLSEYMKTYHPQGFSEKDNSLSDEYKGYVRFIGEDAASIIKTGKTADFSTFTHEIAHSFRRQLSGELKETAEKAFKVENGQWTELQEEAFAVGFEEYIRLRLTENEELEKVFEKGSLYMQRVYNGLDRIIELNPEIIKVYDQMFTHGRFHFNQEEFDKAIDKIANFKDETSKFSSSHVYLGMTPPIYQELGFERLPIMITAKHLQNIMAENGKSANINYHGITPDMIKQIPEAIKKPLIVMQSQNKGNEEDIIAVIGLKDKKGKQIIIPFSPNKKGYFNDLEIDINLAKTIYGRTGFNDFLMRSIKEDRILYVNEKSRELTIPEIQFLRNHKSQLLYNNIAEYHKAVKQKNPDFNILYQKVYHGSRYDFDAFNSSYIGTGEGASGCGYGFYFSEDKADAADYARKLEYEDGEGRVYTVSIPSTRHFLDISRDMYFEDQSKEIKTSLKKLDKVLKEDTYRNEPFSSHANTFFQQLQEEFDSEYEACEYLKKAGVKGITHTEFGNRHFIVFDDENIKISKKQHLKNIRVLYQKQAYYSGGQLEFDFLNDPKKKEEQKTQEKPIQAQNENKNLLNTEHKQNTGIIVQTDKIKILNNTEMERVQIFFPKAPDVEIRNDLKSHGWRWSPRNFCWQRLNTENGLNDAMRIFDKWYKVEEKNLQTENNSKTDKPYGLVKDGYPPVQEVDWYQAFAGSWNTFYPNGTGFKPYIEGYYKNSENSTIKYYNRGVSKTNFGALLEDVNDVVFNAEHLGEKTTDNFLKRFKNYGFYPQKQYTNERGERSFILMIRDGSKSGNVEMIPDRNDKHLQYTVLTKDDDGTILEKKIFDKSDNAQAYMDFKRRKLNGGKEYEGNTDHRIPNGERNRKPLKTYKQAPFEFMIAEKKSNFFSTKSAENVKTVELKKMQSEIKAIEAMKTKAILQTYTNTDYLTVKKPFAKGFFINDSVVYDETPALKKEIESLKKFIISKNNPEYDTRYFMQKMGVCNGFLCATDGKILKRIKLAGLEHLENRSCVKIEYKDRKIVIGYDNEQKRENEYPPAANIIPEGKTIIKFDNEKVKKIIQNLETWDILKPQPKKEYNWDKNILPIEVKEQGIYIGNEKIGIAENTSQDKFSIKINYLHLKKALTNEKNTIFRLDDKKSKINGSTYYTDILHQETEYSSTIIKLVERNREVPEIFNSKELSNFLNTKAPIHKKIEASMER